jgi:integrase
MAARRGRGEGSCRQLASGSWQAILPGRVRGGRTKTFPTKPEALSWLRQHADRKGGAAGTLGDWLTEWMPVQAANTEPGTWRRDAEVIRAFIRPQLGTVRLLNLTGNRINSWLAELHTAGRSDDERHRAWSTLRKILRAHDGYPRGNLDSVRAPRVRRGEALFLDPSEYRRLCESADSFPNCFPFLSALIRVWVECCCRPREALALQWEDYDGTTVRVRRALTTRGKGGSKSLKTEQSARDVPLSEPTRAALDAWRAVAPASPWMFPAANGGHWWYGLFRERVWTPLVERAGLSDRTPKSLRHAGASLLLAAGAPLLAVARRMGHSSPALILRVYGHTMRDDQRKLAGIFEGLTSPHDVRTGGNKNHEKP